MLFTRTSDWVLNDVGMIWGVPDLVGIQELRGKNMAGESLETRTTNWRNGPIEPCEPVPRALFGPIPFPSRLFFRKLGVFSGKLHSNALCGQSSKPGFLFGSFFIRAPHDIQDPPCFRELIATMCTHKSGVYGEVVQPKSRAQADPVQGLGFRA